MDNIVYFHGAKVSLAPFFVIFYAWEQRKLDELVKFYSGLTYKPEDVTENGTLVLRSSNVKNSEIVLTDNVYVDESVVNSDNVKKDDIIVVVRNGSKALIGKHAKIRHSMPNTVIGAFMTGLRSDSPDFINALLSTEMFDKEIKMNMGATINQITGYMFANMEFMTPSFQERQAVGSFFSRLDDLITLHQRKCETLQKLKKSMLQKMFPKNGSCFPEIRFAGFTDAWELRKLGEIADIVGGGTPSTSNPDYWDGDIDWYAPAEISEQIFINSSSRKITKSGFENSSAKMLPVGTVLFTSRAGIGKTAILCKEGCTNQGFQSIVPHENELDSYFIFSRTEELKRYGETKGAGSTFVEVSGKQMTNMTLMMPTSFEEQRQIGAYFRTLDHLITLHQRKPFQHIMEVINIAKRY